MSRKAKAGYRITIFWEEYGTLNEGSMEDTRDLEILSKPTRRHMDGLEALLVQGLRNRGLVKPAPERRPRGRA